MPKPTVQELDALLNSEDDTPVIIRPDGTIEPNCGPLVYDKERRTIVHSQPTDLSGLTVAELGSMVGLAERRLASSEALRIGLARQCNEIEARRRRLEDVSCSQQTHISHLHDHIRVLIDNDPSEPIADNGMTVFDGWRERALILLRGR